MPFVISCANSKRDCCQSSLGSSRSRRLCCAGSPSALGAALVLLLALTWTGVVWADTVRLADGSVLKGEILRVEGDNLIIDTEYADPEEVAVGVEHIVGIEASRRFTVRFVDGQKVTGTLSMSPTGKLVIKEEQVSEAPDTPSPALSVPEGELPGPEVPAPPKREREIGPMVAASTIAFDDVDWIEQEVPYLRYEANVALGIQAARGNSDTTDVHFDGAFKPSFGWNTVKLSGSYDKKKAEGIENTNRWDIGGRYSRDFGRRWQATALNTYEQDRQSDLDLRIVAGGGPAYKFFDEDPMHLRVSPSLAYVRENFSGATADRSFVAFVWFLEFERDLYKDEITFYHDHRLLDSLQKVSNFTAQTKTGMKFELFGDLNLSAELQFDWTNEPAEGKKQDDTRYLIKIGYDWEGDETDWWQ